SQVRAQGSAVISNGGLDNLSNIATATFQGTAGNDLIDLNGLPFRTLINGNAGNDTLRGGLADDTIDGGAGQALILSSAGNDRVTDADGSAQASGVVPGRKTPDQLAQVGKLQVALHDVNGAHTLDVFGPTGAGFQLVGNWQSSLASDSTGA